MQQLLHDTKASRFRKQHQQTHTCTAETSRLPSLRSLARVRRRLRTEQRPCLRPPFSPSLRRDRPNAALLLLVVMLTLPDRSAHEGAAVIKLCTRARPATGIAKKVRGTAPVKLLLVRRAMWVHQSEPSRDSSQTQSEPSRHSRAASRAFLAAGSRRIVCTKQNLPPRTADHSSSYGPPTLSNPIEFSILFHGKIRSIQRMYHLTLFFIEYSAKVSFTNEVTSSQLLEDGWDV